MKQPCLTIEVDPRLIEAVVDFTTEVADVAYTLANLGMSEEAGRLTAALDTLDAAGADDDPS